MDRFIDLEIGMVIEMKLELGLIDHSQAATFLYISSLASLSLHKLSTNAPPVGRIQSVLVPQARIITPPALLITHREALLARTSNHTPMRLN